MTAKRKPKNADNAQEVACAITLRQLKAIISFIEERVTHGCEDASPTHDQTCIELYNAFGFDADPLGGPMIRLPHNEAERQKRKMEEVLELLRSNKVPKSQRVRV